MDKFKIFLANALKHSFWIVCGVVVAISVASWYLARTNLQKQVATNLASIEKDYGTVKTVKDKTNHPNEFSQKGMDQLNKGVLESVLNAWEAQFTQQTKLLVWPPELGDDFVSTVRTLMPIELKVDYDPAKTPPTPLNQELKVDFRQRYANYVESLLPRLAVVIGAKWTAKTATTGMGSGMGPGMGDMYAPDMAATPTPGATPFKRGEKPPIVFWSTGDQGQLMGNHFNWSKQRDSAPTTLQLLYAQEDLWVLQALMSVIKAANGDAESRHEAVVKTIESILIGRLASGRAGQVMLFRGGGSGGEMNMMSGYPMSASSPGPAGPASDSGAPSGSGTREMMASAAAATPGTMPSSGSSPMEGMPGMTRASADPADRRYVGVDYLPLPAETLRAAMKSEKPEDAYYVVAKRMPVRMRLVVDQRKLHRFVTACGNCPLPVEVRQLRINRKGGAEGGGYNMPGYGGMPGSGADMPMSPAGMQDYSGSSGGSPYESGAMPGMMYPGGAGMMGPGMMPSTGPGMMPSAGPGGTGDLTKRVQVSSASDYDVTIELQGIIYIYNPVDKSRLGLQDTPAMTTSVPAPAAPTQG
jgi:hypothetical protein